MKRGPILLVSLGTCLSLASSCTDKKPAPKSPPEKKIPADAYSGSSLSPEAAADAGVAPRDWLCSVLTKVPRGGRFGDRAVAKKKKKHAGIRTVVLRSNDEGQLHLAALAEDDVENDRGLNVNALSPTRAVQAYRYQEGSWEDLGRPFQLIGWGVTLEGVSSPGPVAYAVSTGIGDVRRALIASCENGNWTKQARFLGESFDAAALVTSKNPDTIENISIKRDVWAAFGDGDCKPPPHFRGGRVPTSLRAPARLAKDPGHASIEFAEPGECRQSFNVIAIEEEDSLLLSYEQCDLLGDGEDRIVSSRCQLSLAWLKDGIWKRLAPFQIRSGNVANDRTALALGSEGPLVALPGADGLALYQAGSEGWKELPALPGEGCRLPLALRSDPARIVVRSCDKSNVQVSAYRLDGESWQPVGGTKSLKPKWGAKRQPTTAADWIGETPYLAIGYGGAPVVRVFEGVGTQWEQILETQIDPTSPKNKSK